MLDHHLNQVLLLLCVLQHLCKHLGSDGFWEGASFAPFAVRFHTSCAKLLKGRPVAGLLLISILITSLSRISKRPEQDQALALFALLYTLHRPGLQVAPANIFSNFSKAHQRETTRRNSRGAVVDLSQMQDQICRFTSVGISVVRQSVLLLTSRQPGLMQMSACSCSLHSIRGIAT